MDDKTYINIRIDKAEKALIEDAASAEHLTMSAWMRQTCLKRAMYVLRDEFEDDHDHGPLEEVSVEEAPSAA